MFLTPDPIDIAALVNDVRPSEGAACLFLGVVRDENAGRQTTAIAYEVYGPMAEAEMARITAALLQERPQARLRARHRIGRLSVGEISVAVLATAPHRRDAFDVCRAAIDRIKTSVPIWKKEFHPDGSSEWVDPTGAASA
ncbi:MAG TPA: molybdenum cofactor biosynthesis protein MoaE [Thermoanaerobaculia bacterium]|nr:molybdenum cofactor biosynthesis protein MoaE [Thermoanaerobaculia bacterium]